MRCAVFVFWNEDTPRARKRSLLCVHSVRVVCLCVVGIKSAAFLKRDCSRGSEKNKTKNILFSPKILAKTGETKGTDFKFRVF